MRLQTSLKQFFFDRRLVQDKIGIAEARNLSRIGAFIRTRARSLLRRRKGVSAAGSPPSVHSRDRYATLKNIQFYYDQSAHSVVVGPIKISVPSNQNQDAVPGLLEFGGSSVLLEERIAGSNGPWFHQNPRFARTRRKEVRKRTVSYTPRPWMGPALAMEVKAGTIRDVWRASITG